MRYLITIICVLTTSYYTNAQCAMCKTTIVNNVSNGELALAEGLNFGIIYLFSSPYLAFAVIAGVVIFKFKQHAKSRRGNNKM